MLSGSIDTLNDINAATLVLATARKQLDTLEQDEIVAAKHSASANAGCVEMAGSIRRSEELVLRRICEGLEVDLLFQVPGLAEAVRIGVGK
mmetsp:Transcript_18476/g.55278  ORF Transcript_18476/g.55278 Transcript_18476/m.55278 type:complete len:91 (+) Transcript_18476:2-274(+)